MNCLDEGILRAKLDAELSDEESRQVDRHLASCSACRLKAEALAKGAAEVRGMFDSLAPRTNDSLNDAHVAFARFQSAEPPVTRTTSIVGWLFSPRLRPAWAGAALVAVVIACFSFAPARSWAQRVLAMLRVQKIAVVPIDTQAVEGMQAGSQSAKMVGQFISDNIIVTMHPGDPQPVADASQATQMAGFPIRLLGARADAPRITVLGEQAYQMTLNRDRLEGLLSEIGHTDLQIPASIDGALLAVHIPKSAFAAYGQCPKPGKKDDAQKPPKPADFAGCVMLAEIPSPTVSVPPDLNVRELATLALQASGMSAEDAQNFTANVDWTSTMVVPLPRDAGSYETTSVDGVQGTLMSLRGWSHGAPGYSLLWVKSGIIYTLSGFGSADQAVPLAESLE